MAKIKKEEAKGGTAEWLATYSDMMTILFVLFVLFYSMSSINPVKWDVLVQTYGNKNKTVSSVEGSNLDDEGLVTAPDQNIKDYLESLLDALEQGAAGSESDSQSDASESLDSSAGTYSMPDFEFIFNFISQYVQDKGYAELIDVEKDEFEIMIRFKDRVLFQSGKAIIGAEGRETILFIGEAIKLVLDQVDKIKIEGHTDSVPESSWQFGNNWGLGAARANAVVAILAEAGIPADIPLLESVSRADTVPIDTNETAEGRAANRRVEIYITRKEIINEEIAPESIINEAAPIPDETEAVRENPDESGS